MKSFQLTNIKILELTKLLDTYDEVSFYKFVEILFEREIAQKYYEDSEDYPDNIRYNIYRLNRLVGWLVQFVEYSMPICYRIDELQSVTPEINDKMANLMIGYHTIIEEIKPLFNDFMELLDQIKEQVDKYELKKVS